MLRRTETSRRLTDLVLAARPSGKGLWGKLRTDAPNDALRSNIKVFLAGALEATTSYATWAISHLARNDAWQEKIFCEVGPMPEFSPERLASARDLGAALEETLRLTPSLYFLPRKATTTTRVAAGDGRVMEIPKGTHILLDVWHANRHPDHWGEAVTGYDSTAFAPERWEKLAADQSHTKEHLHFGFGHGSRVCPGKHLGHLEVALVVGAFVKLFRFRALHSENPAKAGVSTKPADGTLIELELREPSAGMTTESEWESLVPG
jgi:cytochrome P450